MAEQAKPETSLPRVHHSKKLVAAVATLAFLPLVLPVPFIGLDRLWIEPAYEAKLQACASWDCPAAFRLDQLSVFLILGPSVLAALTSILLGIIGRIRIHKRSTAQEQAGVFTLSVVIGAAWVLLLGCAIWLIMTVLIYL